MIMNIIIDPRKKKGVCMLSFSQALDLLKNGKAIKRLSWENKTQNLKIKTPIAGSDMTTPYIFVALPGDMTTSPPMPGKSYPYVASQKDILADDWVEA